MLKLIRSELDLDARVQVMGVLNVTPDSFSDGGQYDDAERAVERALQIEAEGADILDLGGESTRPGSQAVSVEEELRRVLPVLEQLSGRLRIPISIDTTKAEVARQAVAAGAELINDISGLRFDPMIAEVAAETGAALLLMHSRGTPATMQKLPPVADIFVDVMGVLRQSIELAASHGVGREKMILDPGIGFGKTPAQNLQLINGLDRLIEQFNLPLLLGTSRKSFLRLTLKQTVAAAIYDDQSARRGATAASVALGIARGARLIRVHDIAEMVAAARIAEAILQH